MSRPRLPLKMRYASLIPKRRNATSTASLLNQRPFSHLIPRCAQLGRRTVTSGSEQVPLFTHQKRLPWTQPPHIQHLSRQQSLLLTSSHSPFVTRIYGRALYSTISTGSTPEPEPVEVVGEEDIKRYAPGGYHPVRIGDTFRDGKYEILRKMGHGLHSTVWLANNTKTNQRVAIKILTADIYDGKNDTFELALLSQIRDKAVQTQGAGGERILGLLDDFVHDGPNGRHVCLVFPPMGPDLTVAMALYEYGRFPVSVVKQIARDMLAALAFLHDECGVIHTDIKPSNILIETPGMTRLFRELTLQDLRQDVLGTALPPPKDYYMNLALVLSSPEDMTGPASFRLADFGTSSWTNNHLSEWIQPQKLRSPEVILGVPWDAKADIWNLGALLFELATDKLLFDGKAIFRSPYASEAHLAQMQMLFGPIPKSLLERAPPESRQRFLKEDGTLKHTIEFESQSLAELVGTCNKCGRASHDEDQRLFVDMLERMLKLEPNERPSARKLLSCEWLKSKD